MTGADASSPATTVGDGLPEAGSPEAARIFFPGQLGKYIPGSVWSIGAQAASAARRGVPARDVAATGLLFLGVHVASAGLAAGLLGLVRPPVDGPARWVWVLGAVLGLAAMSVPVLRLVGSRLAGHRPEVPIGQWWSMLGAMTTAWASYSMATGLLLPDPGWRAVATAALAFAMAYAVGVVVVIAPAGVGAREATFVAVTAPTIGVGAATATALLTRDVHTVADVAWAAVATRMGKRAPERVSG